MQIDEGQVFTCLIFLGFNRMSSSVEGLLILYTEPLHVYKVFGQQVGCLKPEKKIQIKKTSTEFRIEALPARLT